MATANPPPGALAVDNHNGSDPFVSGSHDAQRQRYAAFDNSQFSLYLNGSPAQAKRALQAHLAETTRRLQETSHLGNSLVQQRRELEEKLQEVEQQQQESDIGPDLRHRLAELEKEFNEVGRETARAFLPKSRVPSGETDTTGGAFVYSSEAQHSPTKVSVPSRKQRNQQPSRINDIALATEISTSLLSQLKDLQAVLLEKEDALKAADLDRSQLEIEVEGLSQRLRTLDESESRLKDVNWNLETQVRESELQSKSAVDKEHRLNHALNLVEDLSTQNQELAKAVAYRMKIDDQIAAEDTSPDDGGEERETQTPEHSPPPSPSKATPRHGMLESETLKHSLQHAHRMIQQLKNNIHREKTEKIELKRMLQDARDELETNRGPLNAPGSAGKRRKTDKDIFKKPARPDRLGALRSGTHEIIEDEEDWEEQEGMQNTPSRRPRPADHIPGAFTSGFSSAAETSANEGFETANETSDAAFETANERDGTTTETDAFLTGAETLDGESSEELTETEAGSAQVTKRQSRSSIARGRHQDSYESTASTSGDEYDEPDIRTPIQNQHPRFRLKPKQSGARLSTPRSSRDLFAITPPIAKDSPASFASNSRENTPAQGKSLFAELEDLSGDEDGSSIGEGTPSRSSVLFSPDSSPDATRRSVAETIPQVAAVKPAMVDSGMMTESEPVPRIALSAIKSEGTQPQVVEPATLHRDLEAPSGQAKDSRELQSHSPLQLSNLSAHSTAPTSAPAPLRPTLSKMSSQTTEPFSAQRIAPQFSELRSHSTEPVAPRQQPLQVSTLSSWSTEPTAPRQPVLQLSDLSSRSTEPQEVQKPKAQLSSLVHQSSAPLDPRRAALTMTSTLSSQVSEPVDPVKPAKPELTMLSSLNTEPVAPQQQLLREAAITSHHRCLRDPRQRIGLSRRPSQSPLEPSQRTWHNHRSPASSTRCSHPLRTSSLSPLLIVLWIRKAVYLLHRSAPTLFRRPLGRLWLTGALRQWCPLLKLTSFCWPEVSAIPQRSQHPM
ncbi:hypothetical protein FB567DRAFT_256313 [Paraphoma chrysanthemicola]|uniref:Anucleate primary sterigmata protein A n=1 Tax=Paraphoma chrysanthemicola TaxID=798071 RepID=A0A8K0QS88_9PLEO|nr:hypothetical protein FB567DRAFT_256313 [Paraphoma chrysanthemicola]